MNDIPLVGRANRLFSAGQYAQALALYRALASEQPALAASLRLSIVRCERRLLSGAVQTVAPAAPTPNGPRITIVMTTIKARLPRLAAVLESLHNQSLAPVAIELHISREPYLLDAGIAEDDPELAPLLKLPLLRVRWVDNIGPYRKIWPFLERHFAQSATTDKLFVTVDDDTVYPAYFLAELHANYLAHDCVIAFRGRHIEHGAGGLAKYDQWTWGQTAARLSNLPTGKDGILYSTKFFTREFLALADALAIAPTADDLWIRWHCAVNGVPAVVLNPEACSSDYKSFPVVEYSQAYRGTSLYAAHNSSASQGRNDTAVRELESYYLERYGYGLLSLLGEGIAA